MSLYAAATRLPFAGTPRHPLPVTHFAPIAADADQPGRKEPQPEIEMPVPRHVRLYRPERQELGLGSQNLGKIAQ